jgi:hypothetical protein
MTEFKRYRRKGALTEMRPYEPGESLADIYIPSLVNKAGTAELGDMIARNPETGAQWLLSARYVAENYELDEP